MEHRWSLRSPVDVDVVIYHHQLGKMRGRSRNICLEGMFVEMEAEKPPRNALVDLVVGLRVGSQNILYRLRALVIHVTERGVGFMFRDFDINFFRYLQRMLNGSSDGDLSLFTNNPPQRRMQYSS